MFFYILGSTTVFNMLVKQQISICYNKGENEIWFNTCKYKSINNSKYTNIYFNIRDPRCTASSLSGSDVLLKLITII